MKKKSRKKLETNWKSFKSDETIQKLQQVQPEMERYDIKLGTTDRYFSKFLT